MEHLAEIIESAVALMPHPDQPSEDRDALLRVAALVAGGAGLETVCEAVAAETSRLIDDEATTLVRFDGKRTYTVVGACAGPAPVGTRAELGSDDEGLMAEILRTGRSARVEDDRARGGPAYSRDNVGLFSSVGVPITVDDRLWGVLAVTANGHRLPPAAERRLQRFAVPVSGAVANAHVRAELQALTDERAALRRIHSVAGRGGTGAEVLAAVAAEGSAWLGGAPSVLIQLEDDGTAVVVASSGPGPPVGRSENVLDDSLIADVLRSGRPCRVDDFSVRSGAQVAQEFGVRAAVGVPVKAEGRIWGVFGATSPVEPLPPDAEHRLARFTESIIPTILSAQARTQLAEDQLALRRVAELVTGGAGSDEVFTAVVREASLLARGAAVTLARSEHADRLRIIAAHGALAPATGTKVTVNGQAVSGWIAESQDVRFDGDAGLRDTSPAHQVDLTGWVVVPIRVSGALWGLLGATPATANPLPPGTEHRLHQFADLVAAALANAQARAEIQALADEQAAMRRVAELAARDAPADQVLGAVVLEASALAGVTFTTLLRYDPDGSTEIVAVDGAPDGVVVGMRAPGDGDGAVQRVWRTGRAARIENLATMSGHWPHVANQSGFTTSAAVPITIQGALWGALVAVGRLEVLPASIEEHLTNFADLAGTAITAAQARRELHALAEEQAALGRVADLVVRGAALDEVFTALARETSGLLGGLAGGLWRLESDDSFVLVANANCLVTVGFHAPPYPGTPFGELIRTGAPARVDNFEGTPLEDAVSQLEIGPTATVPITVEGRLWGAMSTSTWQAPLPVDVERRLLQFAELAGAAIANAENKAKLTTSRARVVATADETRRRLQRDVHDSAQQRLVHTIIALKLARNAITNGTPPDALVDEALVHAERANSELRDLVQGILPAALTMGGLRTGLESLLSDFVLPVELSVTAPRVSAQTELTAYFIIAEALTNVVKHAQANRAAVSVALDGAILAVEVRDDGIGGADPARGTGLLGLVDRVDAAGGGFTLTSPPGGGTTLVAHLPLEPPQTAGQ